MRFGIVGLGRMGGDLGLQAIEKGHHVVGYNRSPERTRALEKAGFEAAFSLDELVSKLAPPHVLLVYVPHGRPTEMVIGDLGRRLQPGDLVADGGNSHWKASVRHHETLATHGIAFVDVGTSGGVEGARHGACFMVGADADAFARVEPLLRDLAAARSSPRRPRRCPRRSGAILEEGWNAEVGAFTQAFGSRALDASVLMIPLVGFLPATDPRVRSTVDRIEQELTSHGLVYRYLTEDGLPGGEGTFAPCTFWLVDALALGGRVDEARALFERATRHANDVGLLAEEIDPTAGELRGNFPQAFTHLALIRAATNPAKAEALGAEEEAETPAERQPRAEAAGRRARGEPGSRPHRALPSAHRRRLVHPCGARQGRSARHGGGAQAVPLRRRDRRRAALWHEPALRAHRHAAASRTRDAAPGRAGRDRAYRAWAGARRVRLQGDDRSVPRVGQRYVPGGAHPDDRISRRRAQGSRARRPGAHRDRCTSR